MERNDTEASIVHPMVWRVARAFPMSGFPPENSVAPDSSTPTSECWPEEDALRTTELRRSRGGRK